MALCKDLKVVEDEPVVTVDEVTFLTHDEGNKCVEFDSCEQHIDNVKDQYVSMQATVTVADANAKFKIKSEFKKDNVSKSHTTAQITQSIGTVIYCMTTTELYTVASYTDLVMTIIDLESA